MPSDIILTEFPTHFAPSETSVTFCEYPLFEIFILLKFTSLSAIVALKTFAELPPLPTVIFISPQIESACNCRIYRSFCRAVYCEVGIVERASIGAPSGSIGPLKFGWQYPVISF